MENGIRLTGLWRNEGRDGRPYMAGSLGGGRLVVFPNERKERDADPDFVVYLVPAERREEGGGSRPGGPTRARQAPNAFADGGAADRGDPFRGMGGGRR